MLKTYRTLRLMRPQEVAAARMIEVAVERVVQEQVAQKSAVQASLRRNHLCYDHQLITLQLKSSQTLSRACFSLEKHLFSSA
jgi:hypothetical protein